MTALPVVQGSAKTGWGVSCGGQCCRRFTTTYSQPAQQAKYAEIIAWRDSGGDMEPWMLEHVMVAEMLVQLPKEDEADEDEPPTFTCKYFDSAAGLCTVYERRPGMCRDYPAYEPEGKCRSCGFVREIPQPATTYKVPAALGEAVE